MNDLMLSNENSVIVDRRILSIEEYTEKDIKSYHCNEGYTIKLSDGSTVDLYIDMAQDCCESPGYFMSEDDFSDYIGANLLKVEVVDTELRKYSLDEDLDYSSDSDLDGGDVMFVNLETTEGTLQFVAYNYHNGYYGHGAYVAINNETVYEVYV